MKKAYILFGILVFSFFLFGCLKQCASSCNDGNSCTLDYCNSETHYECMHETLNGAQPGCSGQAGVCSNYICKSGNCIKETYAPCCGNLVCEEGETYHNCLTDCEAPSPDLMIEVLECKTSFSISKGEVTDVIVIIRNLGDGEATYVRITGNANDLDSSAPVVSLSRLQAGYETVQKLTLDTKYGVDTSVTASVTSKEEKNEWSSSTQCHGISNELIDKIGKIAKIGSLIPS